MFFPDIDRMFQEMDEMMESSFSGLSRRPSSMLAFEKFPQAQGLGLRQPLGIEVSQDENEFKVSINLSDVEAKDLDLQLDSDGRVLRLKGQKVQEESGMKIKSSYEKAILLHPDVDTDKISASFSDGVLSIVAPKVEKKEDLEEKKPKKIDIHVEANAEEPTAVVTDDAASHQVESPKASTRLAIENMTNEKAEVKKTTDYAVGEKKWPARDFPY
jgi:HSP20 family protein